MTTAVVAMAGISAAEREVVETVRVHILPMEVTEFVTESGDSLMVGGPDLVPGYHAEIQANIEERGDCYIPQLVDHGTEPTYSTAAVGMVREALLEPDGIWLLLDLWEEGVSARLGRDFVSAYWLFGNVGGDGRPTSTRIVECSFTSTPQFSLAQKPVSELETITDETSALFPIAAAMRASVPPTKEESPMTIEEILEQLLTLDGFAEAVREIARADMAEEPEAMPEAEAMDGDTPEEEEKAAASEDGDDADAEAVAASALRSLDALADRLERLEKASAVKASLREQKSTLPTTPDVPKEFGARVLHFRNQGLDRPAAVKAAQTHGA